MKYLLFIFLFFHSLSLKGQVTFERTYGDTGIDNGLGIIQTFEGGFLITAIKGDFSNERLYLIRTNILGDTLWTKAYDWDIIVYAKGIQTFDSGFVFTGVIGSKVFLYKINSIGDSLWFQQFIPPSLLWIGSSLVEDRIDHSFFIVGQMGDTNNSICCHPVTMRTDSLGNEIWTHVYSYSGRAYSIVQSPDNNFVISYSQIGGPPIPYLKKVNNNDSLIWNKTFPFYCECVHHPTIDGGYIISGLDQNTYKSVFVKTDSFGNIEWIKNNLGWDHFALNGIQTLDSTYISVGSTRPSPSDLIILKMDAYGDSSWVKYFGGTNDDAGIEIINCSDGGFAIVGYTKSFGIGNQDVYFIKTNSLGIVTSVRVLPVEDKLIVNIYPNPWNETITLRIKGSQENNFILNIYNSFGELVRKKVIHENIIMLNRESLPAGIYFYHLISEQRNLFQGEILID